jgi:hypothetical protein
MTHEEAIKVLAANPLKGCRFNVVRRPLSGGKGTIVRHKPSKSNPSGESAEAYYDRLGGVIRENAQDFFFRWSVTVTPGDLAAFRRRCLDPLLEQLCDWWEFVSQCDGNPWVDLAGEHPGIHWQHPYGCVNLLNEGGVTDVDEYIRTGSTAGLVRSDKLFEELQ